MWGNILCCINRALHFKAHLFQHTHSFINRDRNLRLWHPDIFVGCFFTDQPTSFVSIYLPTQLHAYQFSFTTRIKLKIAYLVSQFLHFKCNTYYVVLNFQTNMGQECFEIVGNFCIQSSLINISLLFLEIFPSLKQYSLSVSDFPCEFQAL